MAGASQSAKIGATGAAPWWLHALARPQEALTRLRLALGGVTLFGVLVFVFGTSWDIQWHSFIGRDRALVPPHLLMLGGILLCGVAALSEIAVETFWARTTPAVASRSTPFAGVFHGSLGAYVAGFAALAAAVGFPLDVYWHALYGIDVSVWAPFHVQIITGMSIVALGAAYMLLSGANLAEATGTTGTTGATWPARAGRIGVTVAAGALLCALLFFLDAAFDDAAIRLPNHQIDTYPLMVGAFGGFALALVAAAWPWRFAATGAALAFYLIDAVVFLAVPPLTDALVVAEHQSYRHGGHPAIVVVSFLWPLTLIVGAALIDLAMGQARRRGWTARQTTARVRWAAALGGFLVPVLYPIYVSFSLSNAQDTFAGPAVLALALALLLGAAGGWLGSWLGLEVGASLRRAER
jgi:hypothetical protein